MVLVKRVGAICLHVARSVMGILLIVLISSAALAQQSHLSVQQTQVIFPEATDVSLLSDKQKIWTVYQATQPIGYAFYSIDFAPITAFSGKPVNLLIGLTPDGKLKDVHVVHHQEPIFLHGLGEPPLMQFLSQYRGVSLKDKIRLGGHTPGAQNIDGITKATVSVVAMHDTIISSAMEVARATLSDFSSSPLAVPKQHFAPYSIKQLLEHNFITHWQVSSHEATDRFPWLSERLLDQRRPAINWYIAYLNTPMTGKNLLGNEGFSALSQRYFSDSHTLLICSAGQLSYFNDNFVPAAIPETISLSQQGIDIPLRDTHFFDFYTNSHALSQHTNHCHIFKILNQSGFNPSAPWRLNFSMSNSINPWVEDKQALFTLNITPSQQLFTLYEPEIQRPDTALWKKIWHNRWGSVSLLVLYLMAVTLIFIFQHRLTAHASAFHRIRTAAMLFTLLFIGWYAQGQLSIVNIYPILQTYKDGFSLAMYLMDPMLFILWSYTFVSLLIVGRGVFCGWLCPFGALQEMVGWVAKALRIRQWKITQTTHQRLNLVKYGVLAGLIVTCVFSLQLAETASEIEPFKTVITLQFVRTWPFVLYALIILVLGLYINKFYCRYICPLGASLAILGYFHIGEWLTRRKACGSPCTMCSHKCDINAINSQGKINYNECIQCLECIVYYNNDNLCPPLRKQKSGQLIR